MKNLFFYSNYCKYSLLLIKIIENENMDSNFKYISIDDNPSIPSQIHKVPTLVVHNSDVPLEGKHAFDWIRVTSKLYKHKNHKKYISSSAMHILNKSPRPWFRTDSIHNNNGTTSVDIGTTSTTPHDATQDIDENEKLDKCTQLQRLEIMRSKRKQQDYLFHSN